VRQSSSALAIVRPMAKEEARSDSPHLPRASNQADKTGAATDMNTKSEKMAVARTCSSKRTSRRPAARSMPPIVASAIVRSASEGPRPLAASACGSVATVVSSLGMERLAATRGTDTSTRLSGELAYGQSWRGLMFGLTINRNPLLTNYLVKDL